MFKRRYSSCFFWLCFLTVLSTQLSCGNHHGNIIEEIHVGLHQNNELRIQIDISTVEPAELYGVYWPDSAGVSEALTSAISAKGKVHSLVLLNILPSTNYSYRIVTIAGNGKDSSAVYHFKSHDLPLWLREQFLATKDSLQIVPTVFKEGFMLLNKREPPGFSYIVDYKGRIRWYQMVDGTGVKVTHFTNDKTVLSILGGNDYPTSYGNEILEINLAGDTIVHLKKGEADFKNTIHHEIRKNAAGQYITLFLDQRIMDLRRVGGGIRDTVNGDGILILDHNGKKVKQWSVFDVMDPLKDPELLKTKKDWMHANSLSFDSDSNYLISFYNSGQIWKVDARNGSVHWKLGKGGDMQLTPGISFMQSHAVHINRNGSLMFFDNGVGRHLSEVFSLKIDEKEKSAKIDFHIKLPPDIYNDRMGSSYMVNDTSVLCCSSKRKITVLTNMKGILLWDMETAIPPYRIEFLEKERVSPWLRPLL